MNNQEVRGRTHPAEPVQDDRLAPFDPHRPTDHRQNRLRVVAFDPHFGSPSSGSRDFDELV